MWNFTFHSWTSTTDRNLRELTWVRILTLCQLLPVIPGSCLWALKWVRYLWGSLLVIRNRRGGKIIFPLLFILSVGWDFFFSRVSLSKLKFLHCGHCNSGLFLGRLIYLFSLKILLTWGLTLDSVQILSHNHFNSGHFDPRSGPVSKSDLVWLQISSVSGF